MAAIPDLEDTTRPIGAFGFHVSVIVQGLEGGKEICRGAFSDVSGLEATMEPKAIKVGGRNYGTVQRAGPVGFSTVILKRGITELRGAWSWWALFTGANGRRDGRYARGSRCDVLISLLNAARQPVLVFRLENAMPVKFKAGDLNARSTEVAVEEVHFVHEGLRIEGGSA
ncbi:MAG TPA: phage tail protein [Roseomonas sp.]|nr:phage tail protein [Roseomonas sp.]